MNDDRLVKFRLNKNRSVQAIDFLSQIWPGITQYYICKSFFFADREHLLDWGSVISGDRYSALEHGPVPSRIYNLLKPSSLEEQDWLVYLGSRVRISQDGNLRRVFSKGGNDLTGLSGSHREYLESWVKKLKQMSFGAVADLAHEDAAWKAAWAQYGQSVDMDLSFWVDEQDPNRERMLDAISEVALFAN